MSETLSFKEKKAIVFDLDGTIVNLDVDWMHLRNILSNRYERLYDKALNFNTITKFLDFIVELGDEDEFVNSINIIRAQEVQRLENNNYIDEVVYFIRNRSEFGVEKDSKFAVLSLNTRECIIKSLKQKSLNFDYIIGREDVRKWKPDPEGLIKIKEYFNLKSEDVVYFGDLAKDVKTGENAGIDAYYIDKIISLVRNKKKNKRKKNIT